MKKDNISIREKKSFFNAISNTLITIIRAVLMFIVRIVFIRTLGKTYLGVDSLFTNILTVLSIADLGISSAINCFLYKPLSEKNYKKVNLLMAFYKKMYNKLGIFVLCFGLLIMPFLNLIVRENVDYLYISYVIYLLTTVLTYFISYKDSLLTADQNYYKSSLIVAFSYIFMYILRIIMLFLIPNFIIYALIQFVMILIQRVLVNIYITKRYTYIDFKSSNDLDINEKKTIFNNVKALFINKVGWFLVSGTDNIIISALPNLGVGVVGVYANYYSITGMIDTIISRAILSVTSSFGDLAVNEDRKVQENVLNMIQFASFFIFGLISIGFMFLLSMLINLCFGNDFELGYYTVLVICLNFYLVGVIRPLDMVKEATGVFKQDKYANIVQAAINIVLSIVLGKIYGLFGVVLATLISTILIPLWNRPYITYKYVFNKKPYRFLLKQLMYFISTVITYIIIYYIIRFISIDNRVLLFITKGIIIALLYFIIIYIIYGRTKEFKYFIGKVLGLFRRKKSDN